MSVRSRVLTGLVVVALSVAGCSGDDSPDETTTSAPSTTTAAGPSTTGREATCDEVPLPADAADLAEAAADVDGDEVSDRLRSYRTPGDGWHLQVELGAGGGASTPVATFVETTIVVLGGGDVDGDDAEEVWAQTGSGASAVIVGLARFWDCELTQVSFATGQAAEFPVGGTVGNAAGLACRGRLDPTSDLTAYTATNVGEDRYEVTAVEYALDGTVLRETAREVTTVSVTDEVFARANGFSCGNVGI